MTPIPPVPHAAEILAGSWEVGIDPAELFARSAAAKAAAEAADGAADTGTHAAMNIRAGASGTFIDASATAWTDVSKVLGGITPQFDAISQLFRSAASTTAGAHAAMAELVEDYAAMISAEEAAAAREKRPPRVAELIAAGRAEAQAIAARAAATITAAVAAATGRPATTSPGLPPGATAPAANGGTPAAAPGAVVPDAATPRVPDAPAYVPAATAAGPGADAPANAAPPAVPSAPPAPAAATSVPAAGAPTASATPSPVTEAPPAAGLPAAAAPVPPSATAQPTASPSSTGAAPMPTPPTPVTAQPIAPAIGREPAIPTMPAPDAPTLAEAPPQHATPAAGIAAPTATPGPTSAAPPAPPAPAATPSAAVAGAAAIPPAAASPAPTRAATPIVRPFPTVAPSPSLGQPAEPVAAATSIGVPADQDRRWSPQPRRPLLPPPADASDREAGLVLSAAVGAGGIVWEYRQLPTWRIECARLDNGALAIAGARPFWHDAVIPDGVSWAWAHPRAADWIGLDPRDVLARYAAAINTRVHHYAVIPPDDHVAVDQVAPLAAVTALATTAQLDRISDVRTRDDVITLARDAAQLAPTAQDIAVVDAARAARAAALSAPRIDGETAPLGASPLITTGAMLQAVARDRSADALTLRRRLLHLAAHDAAIGAAVRDEEMAAALTCRAYLVAALMAHGGR